VSRALLPYETLVGGKRSRKLAAKILDRNRESHCLVSGEEHPNDALLPIEQWSATLALSAEARSGDEVRDDRRTKER
jgi:hypothetical protein